MSTLALAAPAGAVSPGDVSARPKPPLSSDLRAATPKPRGSVGARSRLGEPTPLPNGATEVLPSHRVVSLYGAPQMHATILGRISPFEAWRRVRSETERYRFPASRPPIRAFELVATIATADRGRDGLYRFRQSQATIADALGNRVDRWSQRILLPKRRWLMLVPGDGAADTGQRVRLGDSA